MIISNIHFLKKTKPSTCTVLMPYGRFLLSLSPTHLPNPFCKIKHQLRLYRNPSPNLPPQSRAYCSVIDRIVVLCCCCCFFFFLVSFYVSSLPINDFSLIDTKFDHSIQVFGNKGLILFIYFFSRYLIIIKTKENIVKIL